MGTSSLFWGRMKPKGKPKEAQHKPTINQTNNPPQKPNKPKPIPSPRKKGVMSSSQHIVSCKFPRDLLLPVWCKPYSNSYHSHLMWECIHYISPLRTAQSRRFWVSTSANSCHHTSRAYTTSKSKADSLQAKLGIKLKYCPQCGLPKYTVARQALSGQRALGSNMVSREKEWILPCLWRGQKDSHTRRGSISLIPTPDFPVKLRKPQVLWSMFSTNSCVQPAHKWRM